MYRHDHVDGNFIIGRNTEHDDSKKLPVMHGYVEDMELSDILHKSLEITNALIVVLVTSQTLYTSHWRSLMQSMSHLFLARCMYVFCTLQLLTYPY